MIINEKGHFFRFLFFTSVKQERMRQLKPRRCMPPFPACVIVYKSNILLSSPLSSSSISSLASSDSAHYFILSDVCVSLAFRTPRSGKLQKRQTMSKCCFSRLCFAVVSPRPLGGPLTGEQRYTHATLDRNTSFDRWFCFQCMCCV